MPEQILRYTVVLGDWSDDGHGRKDRQQIEFFTESADVELTEELIVANYQANVAKLGFGLPELWDEYEKSSPSPSQILNIRDRLGATIYLDENFDSVDDVGLPGDFHSQMELSEELPPFGALYATYFRNELYLEMDEPLDLAMFLILAGLPDVHWRKLKNAPVLFGSHGTPLTGNRHVGYGLYL